MKVSIAMTTFNGGKFVEKQLDSLRLQTLKPDEVFIFDDRSKDDTVEIVNAYISRWQLEGWHIHKNEKNVGWICNFHRVIAATTGDVVFFCDQDDIWDTKKIETMASCMNSNPHIEVLACKMRLIDGEGKSLPDNPAALPFASEESGSIKKNQLTSKFTYSISPGCTMAVKRSLINKLEACECKDEIPHDALYWKLGTLLGVTYTLDRALINYRIHENNASNPSGALKHRIKTKEARHAEAVKTYAQIQKVFKAYASIDNSLLNDNTEKLIENVVMFCSKRKSFIENANLFQALYFVCHNVKYYAGFKMMIGDLLSIIDKSKETGGNLISK